MQSPDRLTTATVERMSQQLLKLDLDADQLEGVAELLNALAAEMAVMHGTSLGNQEPAFTYQAVEP